MNQSTQSTKIKINQIGHAMQIIAIVMIILTVLNFSSTVVYETQYQKSSSEISSLVSARLYATPWFSLITNGLICLFNIVAYVFLVRAAVEFRRCETPFAEETLRRTNLFAIMMIVGAGAEFVVTCVTIILSRSIGLLYFAPILALPVVFAALVMLFLTNVFRHGAALQKEVDETL